MGEAAQGEEQALLVLQRELDQVESALAEIEREIRENKSEWMKEEEARRLGSALSEDRAIQLQSHIKALETRRSKLYEERVGIKQTIMIHQEEVKQAVEQDREEARGLDLARHLLSEEEKRLREDEERRIKRLRDAKEDNLLARAYQQEQEAKRLADEEQKRKQLEDSERIARAMQEEELAAAIAVDLGPVRPFDIREGEEAPPGYIGARHRRSSRRQHQKHRPMSPSFDEEKRDSASRGSFRFRFNWLFYILHVVMFIASLAAVDWKFAPLEANPAFGPALDSNKLLRDTHRIAKEKQFQFLLSGAFINSGVVHLLFSLLVLLAEASFVERAHGAVKTSICFVLSSLFGCLTASVANPLVVGASGTGGCLGLVGFRLTSIYLSRNDPQVTEIRSTGTCIMLIILGFVFGIIPGIDSWAHIGGVLSGMLIGFILHIRSSKVQAGLASIIVFSAVIGLFVLLFSNFSCPACAKIECVQFLNVFFC